MKQIINKNSMSINHKNEPDYMQIINVLGSIHIKFYKYSGKIKKIYEENIDCFEMDYMLADGYICNKDLTSFGNNYNDLVDLKYLLRNKITLEKVEEGTDI